MLRRQINTNLVVDKVDDVLNDINISKNSLLLQSQICSNDVSIVASNEKREHKKSSAMLIKKQLGNDFSIKNFKSNQYPKIRNVVHNVPKKPIYKNITSDVSYITCDIDINTSSISGNRKKISTDRRVRSRQRTSSSDSLSREVIK